MDKPAIDFYLLRDVFIKRNTISQIQTANRFEIDRLFPNFKDYIVIYKKGKKLSNHDANDMVSDDYDFEVTGNPLEYSFGDDKFIDSTLIMERYWCQEEESYLPFNRLEACTILNTCIEHLDNEFVIPIFILCNGEDHNRTTILGCIVQKNWLNTIEVTNGETQMLDVVKNGCSKLLSDHLKLSFSQPCDVSISALSTYHLFGSRHETLRLPENEKPFFKGSVTLNISSDNILFDPSTRSSNNNLILDIITGTNDSVLLSFWHQLLLLNQFLMILDTYREMNSKSHDNSISLQFPSDFVNPCAKDHDKAMENIDLLLASDYSYRKLNDGKIQEIYSESDESNMKLKQYVEDAIFRPNLDFTDYLWELLMCFPDYAQITNCMHKIFQEVLTGEYQPQLNMTNNTKLAKILPELPHQNTVSHLLVECLPLEILIDIGFEKLSRDYKYILMNADCVTFDDMKCKFVKPPEQFDSDYYRKQLINMVQIHISLEFMLLLQTHVNCSAGDLRSSFEYILKEMTSVEFPTKALQELHQHKIYNLTIPAPNILISELNKGIPVTWRVNLVSESKLSKTETITYFCEMPIFPSTMYHPEYIDKVNEVFHVTTAIISSIKIG
ncbi:hypothetical protein KPH14_005950 [Odynerus spinipes]|uniref:Protein zwilch n=1 Tax=Odynerus spinipes TaxID=1348599 RepID=A0AAD9VN87_9HYME|nr:hypothetical protein KPH14_005950 [Odynerus spinipes]